jgi:RNA-binding protein
VSDEPQSDPKQEGKGKAKSPPPPPELTGKQRRHLRALGHSLEPAVQLGKHGLTEAATSAIEIALARHELVKVRLGTECPEDRDEVAARLEPVLRARIAQTLGRTILFYRRHAQKPVIQLPKP